MNEQEILIYQRRQNEFIDLLKSSKSRTSENLITEAINISDENFKLYKNITFNLFEYLTGLTQKKKNNIDKYNEQFLLLETNLKQVPYLDDNKKQKEIMTAYYNANLEILNSLALKENNLHNLMSSVFQFVAQELKITLFDYIFKPNQSEFNIDIIIDMVLLISEKFVPFLGDVRNLISLVKKIKKKNYLKEGDKLFQYLEKYIDVSKLWKELAISFNENAYVD